VEGQTTENEMLNKHTWITFGQQPFILQTIPILIFISRIENSYELYLLGTDQKKEHNKFSKLLK